MTTEDKELLLRDLCAKLYTGTIVNYNNLEGCDYELSIRTLSNFPEESLKCYLRPMSSMTEEERNEATQFEINNLGPIGFNRELFVSNSINVIDWLNAHHFDIRGLIPMELALEAPEGMYV